MSGVEALVWGGLCATQLLLWMQSGVTDSSTFCGDAFSFAWLIGDEHLALRLFLMAEMLQPGRSPAGGT